MTFLTINKKLEPTRTLGRLARLPSVRVVLFFSLFLIVNFVKINKI